MRQTTSTIARSFASILAHATLTEADMRAFESHRRSVFTSLNANFYLSKMIPVGSYARGSSIRHRSDLDLFAVLRRQEVFWGGRPVLPSTLLTRVRDALQRTFTNTSLRKDGEAVVIVFSDDRRIDVVPAWFDRASDTGWPLFYIPTLDGQWLQTSPERHNSFIRDADVRAGGKLKSVVRILKYWKACREADVPLSAFHLELLMAEEGTCNGARSLAECVANAFALLERRGCKPLADPCSISGYIPSASTPGKVERLRKAVASSAPRAVEAVRAESVGDGHEARRLWELVFNGYFSLSVT